MKRIISLATKSAVNALPKAARTSWWLLKIILPVSLAVSILQHIGLIDLAAIYLTPLFSLIGLPGESAIVFITSIFLSLYAPIAIIATLSLEMREITILALMCLITHNMIVETAIQKKTGSSYLRMFLLRLTSSFVAAAVLNWLLPADLGGSLVKESLIQHSTFADMLIHWFRGAIELSLKIVLIITGLMMLQNILRDFRLLHYLSRTFAPLMRFFGLPEQIAFLWLVAQTLGLAYGAAVLIEEVDNKEVSREDANLLNHHIAVNHSMLEDTLLFVAIGVPVLWIMVPRIVLAFIIVWTLRLIQHTTTKNG